MYILYTTSGIIVADSATLISDTLLKIGIKWQTGGTTAIGIEYSNGLAKSYDMYDNVNSFKELSDQINLSQYEQTAKTATGIAVGVITAELIEGAIAVGVGGVITASAAPLIVVSGSIFMGIVAEDLWQAINDTTKYFINQDYSDYYESLTKDFINFSLNLGHDINMIEDGFFKIFTPTAIPELSDFAAYLINQSLPNDQKLSTTFNPDQLGSFTDGLYSNYEFTKALKDHFIHLLQNFSPEFQKQMLDRLDDQIDLFIHLNGLSANDSCYAIKMVA